MDITKLKKKKAEKKPVADSIRVYLPNGVKQTLSAICEENEVKLTPLMAELAMNFIKEYQSNKK